jgi:hypothetical protein
MKRKKKYVHSGNYVAEVEVEMIHDEHPWAPYLNSRRGKKIRFC